MELADMAMFFAFKNETEMVLINAFNNPRNRQQ